MDQKPPIKKQKDFEYKKSLPSSPERDEVVDLIVLPPPSPPSTVRKKVKLTIEDMKEMAEMYRKEEEKVKRNKRTNVSRGGNKSRSRRGNRRGNRRGTRRGTRRK